MKNNRLALNYRPIISITPSKRRVPVDNHDLMELDECIKEKIKENCYEQEMTKQMVKKLQNNVLLNGDTESVSNEQNYTLNRTLK